jgi:hypothetical protein
MLEYDETEYAETEYEADYRVCRTRVSLHNEIPTKRRHVIGPRHAQPAAIGSRVSMVQIERASPILQKVPRVSPKSHPPSFSAPTAPCRWPDRAITPSLCRPRPRVLPPPWPLPPRRRPLCPHPHLHRHPTRRRTATAQSTSVEPAARTSAARARCHLLLPVAPRCLLLHRRRNPPGATRSHGRASSARARAVSDGGHVK